MQQNWNLDMVDELEASYFATEVSKTVTPSSNDKNTIEVDTSTETEDQLLLDAILDFEASYSESAGACISPTSIKSAQSIPATPAIEFIPYTPMGPTGIPTHDGKTGQQQQQQQEQATPAWMDRWRAAVAEGGPCAPKRQLDIEFSESDAKRVAIIDSELSDEQREVLDAVMRGESVFFTGCAGTGKSFLLRQIIQQLPRDTTFVTAPTGIAACHLGGVTLHNFAGIGLGNDSVEKLVASIRKGKAGKRWRKARVLVIDEISMVPAHLFDKVDILLLDS